MEVSNLKDSYLKAVSNQSVLDGIVTAGNVKSKDNSIWLINYLVIIYIVN